MNIIKDLTAHIATYYQAIIHLIPKLGAAILIVFLFKLITRFIRKSILIIIEKNADDKLLVKFIDNIIGIAINVIAILLFLYVIGQAGIAASILGAAGVSAIVLGFAFKDLGENFIAGVMMAFKRPFRIGDTIQSGNVEGSVVNMSLRDTLVKTADGKDVFLPNGFILKNPLFNHTLENLQRKSFTILLEYIADSEHAISIIAEATKPIYDILPPTKPMDIFIKTISSNGIELEVRYWYQPLGSPVPVNKIHTQMIHASLVALQKNHFKLPSSVIEVVSQKEGLDIDDDNQKE